MDGKCDRSVKLHISEALELELHRLADADRRSLSEYVRVVLQRHVYGHRATLSIPEQGSERGD